MKTFIEHLLESDAEFAEMIKRLKAKAQQGPLKTIRTTDKNGHTTTKNVPVNQKQVK